jgi:hypothetical protein
MRKNSDYWSAVCPEQRGRLTLEKEEKLSGTKLADVLMIYLSDLGSHRLFAGYSLLHRGLEGEL